ncbi:MAG: hypothetical protein HQK49_09220 [Oligoflexia bacterium]|nr:hypothetical protein [Oligoflexia bacterium]
MRYFFSSMLLTFLSTFLVTTTIISAGLATVTSERFDEIIDDIQKIYASTIKSERDLNLFIMRLGMSPNGLRDGVAIVGKRAMITISKVVASDANITEDAFAMLVCHEFGHVLGGRPTFDKKGMIGITSVEGQADYWAAAKCFKKYATKTKMNLISQKVLENFVSDIPDVIAKKCKKNFSQDTYKSLICQRTAKAALSLKDYFNLNKSTNDDDYVSENKVAKKTKSLTTLTTYGTNQCRFETYLRGAYCDSDINSNSNCTVGDGVRPNCWYLGDRGEEPLRSLQMNSVIQHTDHTESLQMQNCKQK